MALIIPAVTSQILGVGLPALGSKVMLLTTMAPKRLKSNKSPL